MKRLFDIFAALFGILITAPIMLIIAFLVLVLLGRPILFTQARPGLNGELFNILKFRSMSDKKDEEGNLLSDEERLGIFGRLLRSSSLDELPELFNVLRGDMSLVGPRPLLVEYLPLYTEEQARRHEVIPGLTGWAQVNGRNSISWEDRFKLDVWYVDHRSFSLDMKIIFMTIQKVFKREGVSEEGHVTMSKFTGSENK
jgi:lipopolysaccharide/colanic/teichoic acid biosynthesis glycosyltransferase